MARIPYRTKDDVPEAYRPLLDEDNTGELPDVLNLFRGLANNPPILRSYVLWSRTIWDECGLSERSRELVILALANKLESRYEWAQHVTIARNVGVTADEIRAVSDGDLEQFTDREVALMEYACLYVDRSVDDAAHEALATHVDDGTVVATAVLCSHYVATAGIIDALGIEFQGEFVGWDLDNADNL